MKRISSPQVRGILIWVKVIVSAIEFGLDCYESYRELEADEKESYETFDNLLEDEDPPKKKGPKAGK